ncbi:glycosyltransferase family 4 protein [Clostridium perfringens]
MKNYSISYEQSQIPKHDNIAKFILKFLVHFINYYWLNKNAINKIAKIVVDEKIELIHTNTSVIDIGNYISKKTGIKHVWHLREFGKEDFNFYPIRYNYIHEMNASNNVCLAISKAVKDTWTKKGVNGIEVLYDGVVINPYEKVEYKDNKIRLVMVGSFCEAKGQELLVNALIKMKKEYRKKLLVDFFGGKTSGSYYSSVERLIKENNLEEIITMKGFSNNISEELSKYDIGVLCSRAEAFGRVTAEYMMAGLCLVVPRSGANIELIEDNNCGLIYESQNVDSLASTIQSAIQDQKLVHEYGVKAKQIAEQKYNIDINASSIIDFFARN